MEQFIAIVDSIWHIKINRYTICCFGLVEVVWVVERCCILNKGFLYYVKRFILISLPSGTCDLSI